MNFNEDCDAGPAWRPAPAAEKYIQEQRAPMRRDFEHKLGASVLDAALP